MYPFGTNPGIVQSTFFVSIFTVSGIANSTVVVVVDGATVVVVVDGATVVVVVDGATVVVVVDGATVVVVGATVVVVVGATVVVVVYNMIKTRQIRSKNILLSAYS